MSLIEVGISSLAKLIFTERIGTSFAFPSAFFDFYFDFISSLSTDCIFTSDSILCSSTLSEYDRGIPFTTPGVLV